MNYLDELDQQGLFSYDPYDRIDKSIDWENAYSAYRATLTWDEGELVSHFWIGGKTRETVMKRLGLATELEFNQLLRSCRVKGKRCKQLVNFNKAYRANKVDEMELLTGDELGWFQIRQLLSGMWLDGDYDDNVA